MADRSRRISRGGMSIVEEDCPFSAETAKDEKANFLVEHEDILSTPHHPAVVHEDGQSGNLFSAILNRWLMSNTFYSSSLNTIRFK